ncbi:MAG: energy transducer TonB [Vicingaceae bacterium]|nr:energy transducer TonB [Vicingaceae bacterium]
MKNLLIAFIFFVPQLIFSQQDSINKTEDPVFDGFVETMPDFPGGEQAMMKFIIKNIEYPTIAQENGISGKVFIRFVVDKDGSITDVKTVRGISSELDNEAIRVIKMMPKWTPGTQLGKPVRVMFTLPINFTLK